MKTARIILLFPLALFRLILIIAISFIVAYAGWISLKLFGFSRKLLERTLRAWGKSILFVCGIKVDKNKKPDTEQYILMANHRSYLDIFIISAFTPSAFVAKSELQRWPFIKTGGKITGIIFVSREELKSLVSTMKKIEATIAGNIPVTLFPEGTTFKGPLTKPFKNGSFKIAAEGGFPVIPVAIHYKDEKDAWVDDDTFIGHFFRQMSKPFTLVTVRYGEPLTSTDYAELRDKTKEQINSMLQKISLSQI